MNFAPGWNQEICNSTQKTLILIKRKDVENLTNIHGDEEWIVVTKLSYYLKWSINDSTVRMMGVLASWRFIGKLSGKNVFMTSWYWSPVASPNSLLNSAVVQLPVLSKPILKVLPGNHKLTQPLRNIMIILIISNSDQFPSSASTHYINH